MSDSRNPISQRFGSLDADPVGKHFATFHEKIERSVVRHDDKTGYFYPTAILPTEQAAAVPPLSDERHQEIVRIIQDLETADIDALAPEELRKIRSFLNPEKNPEMSRFLVRGSSQDIQKEQFIDAEKRRFIDKENKGLRLRKIGENVSTAIIWGGFLILAASSSLIPSLFFPSLAITSAGAATFPVMSLFADAAESKAEKMEEALEKSGAHSALNRALRVSSLYRQILATEENYEERQAAGLAQENALNNLQNILKSEFGTKGGVSMSASSAAEAAPVAKDPAAANSDVKNYKALVVSG